MHFAFLPSRDAAGGLAKQPVDLCTCQTLEATDNCQLDCSFLGMALPNSGHPTICIFSNALLASCHLTEE